MPEAASNHILTASVGLILFSTGPTILAGQPPDAQAEPTGATLAATLATAERHRSASVSEVRSVRRYVLHNPRWKSDGSMDVLVRADETGRKTYDILSMRAEGMQKQVFRRILDGEVEASMRKDEYASVTPENYDLVPLGVEILNGRKCRVVELHPKKKTRFLIEGRAWIDLSDAAVARVEGRPARSLSFWVGRPYIVQDFRKVGDFWLSARNHSTADVRFIGKTDLDIDFQEYSVTPKAGSVLMACTAQCSGRISE